MSMDISREIMRFDHNGTNGFLVMGEAGKLLELNRAAHEILGLSGENCLPAHMSRLLPKEVAKHFIRNAPGKKEFRIGDRVLRLDRLGFNMGSADHFMYHLQDLTPWRQLLEELEAYRKFDIDLKTIFDESFDVLYVCEVDGSEIPA
jgi:sensor histidine kinase regulating citrate/malate metabolism